MVGIFHFAHPTYFKGKLSENGISMREFAETLKVSPENLSQKVKRGSITYDYAQEIADLLGYDIEWVERK